MVVVRNKFSLILGTAKVVIITLALVSFASPEANFKVLHEFVGSETGYAPSSSLIFDAAGNLYGTLVESDYNTGMVYKLTPNPDGSWTASKLYRFTGGADGATPQGGLIFDAAGNLYGTTTSGFSVGADVVFKLTPKPDGSWTESVLYSFAGGADGGWPQGGLIFDAAGNLYGTTMYGGNFACQGAVPGCGVVFKLTRNPDGTWTESVLYSFGGGGDGANPQAGLIFDRAGNLYGTAEYGGGDRLTCPPVPGCGVVFKLAPKPDGSWKQRILLRFPGGEGGSEPESPLVFDETGNLFGTTRYGGSGHGIVFKLERNADGGWTENVLHQFTGGEDGSYPSEGLTVDAVGNLYGTAGHGGNYGYGVAFKLKRNVDGSWSEHVLHQFNNTDGLGPKSIIFDSAGSLYGTTVSGGIYGYGVVFELLPQPR